MSDSASVYEPDDDPESESDFDQARPSKDRSPAKQLSTAPKKDKNDRESYFTRPLSSPYVVGQELSDALMERVPPMRGSLTFLRAYKHLLTESEENAQYASLKDHRDIYPVSQYGSVVWTSTEKQAFFNALNRKGKEGIKEIVAAIGTKSELEVIEHIRILHKALEAQFMSDKHVERMPVLSDIPAAMEISQECCELLDEYGDVLVFQESFLENLAGKKQHGDNWIVTSAQAQDLADADDTARGDLRLATGLFNIPDWIRLSQVLFMNFGGSKEKDNWWNLVKGQDNITAKGHTASMTAESLVDFYALAVSVTRRLIQSAIFFSMSRVRSASRTGRVRKPHVRTQDVRAAIEVLNMKHRRPNFVNIARRNEVVIEDIHNRKGWVSSVFSYDEAEDIIDKNEWFRYRKDGTRYRQRHYEEGRDDEDEDYGDEEDYDDFDDDGDGDRELETDNREVELEPGPEPEAESEAESEALSEVGEDDNDSLRTRELSEMSEPLDSSDELEMDPEEEYAEMVDQNASCSHEANIRKLMDLPSTLDEGIKTEEAEGQNKSQPGRRSRQKIMDWRDRTLYRSEWEEYGYNFADLKDEMDMPPQKKRKFEQSTPVLSGPAIAQGTSVDKLDKQGQLQQAMKHDQEGPGPSDGQSWLEYYMSQFGRAVSQQEPR